MAPPLPARYLIRLPAVRSIDCTFTRKEILMPRQTFRRRVLLLDAVASGVTGVLMLAGSGVLEGWLGLPAMLLLMAGASLLPFAALVAWLALRERISRAGVWA